MALSIYLAVQLLTLVVGATAAVPDGYLLEVQCECGPSYTGFANITAVTDLPVRATAVCANGDFLMDVVDGVNHVIAAYYTTVGDECLFFRRARTRTYVVYIHVTLDDEGEDIQRNYEHYTVTCGFNSLGSAKTYGKPIHDSFLAPLEIQTNVGRVSESVVSIYFTDLSGVRISDNSDIPVRKSVKLVAETDGSGGEAGIQVVSCDGTGITEGAMKYPMLRAGCGDGYLLAKEDGFVTSGMKAESPPFNMFHVSKEKVLKIVCNVTLCNTTCDGIHKPIVYGSWSRLQ